MSHQPYHWAFLLCLGASACASTQGASAPAASEPVATTSPEASSQPAAVSAAAAAAEANSPEAKEAVSAAQSWLGLVDSGQYDESWKAAAEVFRGAVTSENWVRAVGGVRGPLGKVESREVGAAELKTSLPGAPDGKYVLIQFNTTFEHKASAAETVTQMQQSDGSWQVAGYFVK